MCHLSKMLVSAVVLASLAACGGGGSASAPDNSQVIKDALTNIGSKLPPPAPAYSGAYVSIDGEGIGYVSGSTEGATVAAAVSPIVDNPQGHDALYRKLLSDSGLIVTIHGEKVGTGAVSGLPLYAPDSVYVVRLTVSGLVILKK